MVAGALACRAALVRVGRSLGRGRGRSVRQAGEVSPLQAPLVELP